MAGPSIASRVDVSDVVGFARTVRLWAEDQLPFAAAAALTDTAKDAVSFVRNGLVDSFKLRNQGLRNAIAYEPADKRGSPIQARVGVRPWAQFLVFHAIGGLKRAHGGGRVAVPTRMVKRTATGRVPKRLKPRSLRERKELIEPVLDKRGLIALSDRRTGAKVFYTLAKQAHIKARWPFHEQVRETVEARLGHHFINRARQALKPR